MVLGVCNIFFMKIITFLIYLIILISCNTAKISSVDSKKHTIKHQTTNEIQSKQRVIEFSNSNYGISFFYPDSWKLINESNVINLQGHIMSKVVSFHDQISNTSFVVEYHLPPHGIELYKLSQEEFESSDRAKEIIKIDGKTAYKTSYTKIEDIKGNIYDPALNVIQIDFLDKSDKGEYHLFFQSPINNKDIEVKNFNDIISSLKLSIVKLP